MSRKIGIGIDTGGTYTDAVIYGFSEKKVLASAKALTTRQDLSVGILEALDKLPLVLLKEAGIIALSTTLATNACVEDKGGRARLVFFGGDEKVINERGAKYGLPQSDEIHIQESFTDFSGFSHKEPDWDFFAKAVREKFKNLDGAGIIELNAMRNSGIIEKKAKEIFQKQFDIPVVCGHELFSELNSLQRGSSTLLNARLFPVIEEFLTAIKTSISQRGIDAVSVIVRSDGSVMSDEFARLRPVETLLCGPAASVAGGSKLSGENDCVIVDMGGTTTDIALVKDGIPVSVTDGIAIGKWRTFVHGFYIKTFGLGGDSAVHYREGKVCLEEYRVVPLCVAASRYPEVGDNLRRIAESYTAHSLFIHEHYILANDIRDPDRHTETEKRFCAALRKGPLVLKDAAAAIDTDIYNFNVSRLLKEGVVQICGLTPTDIMHIKNDFSGFNREASLWGAKFTAFNLGISVDELCHRVYDEIKQKLYINIVKILLENSDRHYSRNGIDPSLEAFIKKSYDSLRRGHTACGGVVDSAKKNPLDKMISFNFKTGFSLVGIGAPIHIFLKDVADLLGTKALIPEFHEVANAVGAVASGISASFTVNIRPEYSTAGVSGYSVSGCDAVKTFKTLKEAEAFAVFEAKKGAETEARKRGAAGGINISCEIHNEEGIMKDGVFYMGTVVKARALGDLGN
ncbi:MAG: hydantoinase/oxoprolinase family protein [Treponema sp.]|jgi:N-methylhydantoinase A/oxoprolinase/acetone carboxylase beta subunit|nr:hydantoinase/oxoprolinase family protein [Treponema sp.]